MSVFRFPLALAGAVLLHLVGVRWVPHFADGVDGFLVVAVWFAVGRAAASAQLAGMASGLVHDAFSGAPFGLHGLANTVVGYVVARSAQRLMLQQRANVALVFVLGAAAQQSTVLALLLLLQPDAQLPQIRWILVKLALTPALGLALVGGEARGRRWWAARRRRRPLTLG